MKLMDEKPYSFVPPRFFVKKIVLEYVAATVGRIKGISNQSILKSIFEFLIKDVHFNFFFFNMDLISELYKIPLIFTYFKRSVIFNNNVWLKVLF